MTIPRLISPLNTGRNRQLIETMLILLRVRILFIEVSIQILKPAVFIAIWVFIVGAISNKWVFIFDVLNSTSIFAIRIIVKILDTFNIMKLTERINLANRNLIFLRHRLNIIKPKVLLKVDFLLQIVVMLSYGCQLI